MNHISDKNKIAASEKTSSLKNYENPTNPKSYDEEKLLELIDQRTITSKVKWITFRDECIQHMIISETCSVNFYDKFIKLVQKLDPIYYDEQGELFQFLNQIILWKRDDLKNIDIIINRFSRLYVKCHEENNETMIHYLRFLTQTLLKFVIDKHGSSAIIKFRNSFEKICEKTHDYELMYILWRKLFER